MESSIPSLVPTLQPDLSSHKPPCCAPQSHIYYLVKSFPTSISYLIRSLLSDLLFIVCISGYIKLRKDSNQDATSGTGRATSFESRRAQHNGKGNKGRIKLEKADRRVALEPINLLRPIELNPTKGFELRVDD